MVIEETVELFDSAGVLELIEENAAALVGESVEEELSFGLHGILPEVGVLPPGPAGLSGTGWSKEYAASGDAIPLRDFLRLKLFVEATDATAVLDVRARVGEGDLPGRGSLDETMSNGMYVRPRTLSTGFEGYSLHQQTLRITPQ